jgi:hypothetical protein
MSSLVEKNLIYSLPGVANVLREQALRTPTPGLVAIKYVMLGGSKPQFLGYRMTKDGWAEHLELLTQMGLGKTPREGILPRMDAGGIVMLEGRQVILGGSSSILDEAVHDPKGTIAPMREALGKLLGHCLGSLPETYSYEHRDIQFNQRYFDEATFQLD